MPSVTANGIEIYCERHGSGPRLLFFNGSGATIAQAGMLFAPYVEHFEVLVSDLRGGAYPSSPLPGSPLTAEDATTDLTLYDTRFSSEWLASHDTDRFLAEMLSQRRSTPTTGETRRGQLEQLGARSRHDCVDRLSAITCPTFVASGRYDGVALPANGQALADRLQHSVLKMYEGGHLFFAQDPTALPDVFAFLGAGTKGNRS